MLCLKLVVNTGGICSRFDLDAMQILDHCFFVTGGSSGLGRAVVKALVAAGAYVVIADQDSEKGDSLSKDLNQQALFITTDVSEETSIVQALRLTLANFKKLHGVINCAGVLVAERLLKKDGNLFNLAGFRRCIDVNLIGTFNVMRLACPIMAVNQPEKNGERGLILNTASIAAYDGQIGQAAYAASKAGIIGMTLPIARELGKSGIRVMAIAPGVFETPLFTQIGEDKRTEIEQNIPFPRRLGKPSEFAALALHIIDNPMLNGEVIRLDGALRL